MNHHDPNPQSWSAIRARPGMESHPVLRIKRVRERIIADLCDHGERRYMRLIGPRLPTPDELCKRHYRLAYSIPPVGAKAEKLITLRTIIAEVCAKYDVTRNDILSYRRADKVLTARWETMWRGYYEANLSASQIARDMGRDHTTVINGAKQYQKMLDAQAGLSS